MSSNPYSVSIPLWMLNIITTEVGLENPTNQSLDECQFLKIDGKLIFILYHVLCFFGQTPRRQILCPGNMIITMSYYLSFVFILGLHIITFLK